jgi:hypothetical protein
MTRLGPREHQDRYEAPRETAQKLYVLLRDFLEVPEPQRMRSLGGS